MQLLLQWAKDNDLKQKKLTLPRLQIWKITSHKWCYEGWLSKANSGKVYYCLGYAVDKQITRCSWIGGFFDTRSFTTSTGVSRRLHHLPPLCSRYGSGDKADISIEELHSEWVALKQLLSQRYREMKCKEFLILMSSDGTLITMFPNSALLAPIALITPVSTAECECCFFLYEENQDHTHE